MISCMKNQRYTEAHRALDRKQDYRCPECNERVILKAGAKITPHFAHKVGGKCNHGLGETEWHRKGKMIVASILREKGYDVFFEHKLGERRTDLFSRSPNGTRLCFEFQRKDEGSLIYNRTRDLAEHCDTVTWVLPFGCEKIDGDYRRTASYAVNSLFSEKRPKKSRVLFFDLRKNAILVCAKKPWYMWINPSEYGGGYWRTSRRWCEIIVKKAIRPCEPHDPEKGFNHE
jgi:competence CoiA-like predicted nuclease